MRAALRVCCLVGVAWAAGVSVDADSSLGEDPERNAGNSRVEERRAEKQKDRDRREAEKQRQKDMLNPPKWNAAMEDSEYGNIPRLPAHPRGDGFCSEHFLAMNACHKCEDWAAVGQRTNQLANASDGHGAFKSAHMLYLHAQKTGGSTLECATEGNPLSVRWTNMGHTTRAAVDNCIKRCTFGEGKIPPKVIVMAREPYSFWSSRYLFAKACVHAATCTAWVGITSFLGFLTYIENHGNFVAPDPHNETWVANRGTSPWEPQSFIMQEQCGKPCKYDYLLHTETMQEDWIKLMDKMGEPRTLLPHDVNPTNGAKELVVFDDAALDIIHRLDANMFEEWGYKKRAAFNLRVQTGTPH